MINPNYSTATPDPRIMDTKQTPTAGPSSYPFDNLPIEIKDWLRSDAVNEIVSRLNDKYDSVGLDRKALGKTITRLALNRIRSEDFLSCLINDYKTPPELAVTLAKEVREKILQPISGSMRSKLGIDIDKITEGAPAAPAGPTAQITKLAKPLVADIRKPEPAAKPQAAPIQPKPVAPTNTANKAEINTQFGFVEVDPTPPPGFKEESLAPPAATQTAPKPPTQPAVPQQAAPQTAMAQKAPEPMKQQPHEVVPYKDDHPVVE